MNERQKDARLELLIGRVLRAGILTSSACLASGLAMFLVHSGAGSWLLRAGIVVLIATPAARVVLSIVDYLKQRDWPFVALTTFVLVELAAGVVAALAFNHRL